MKAAMIEHVDTERHSMFPHSCEEVRTKLKAMLRQVEELMGNKADEVFVAISRDYRSVLGGSDAPQGEMMPRWQRTMRKEVKTVINRAEKILTSPSFETLPPFQFLHFHSPVTRCRSCSILSRLRWPQYFSHAACSERTSLCPTTAARSTP